MTDNTRLIGEIFERAKRDHVNVVIFAGPTYGRKPHCTFEVKRDDTEVKVRREGDTVSDAVVAAHDAFYNVINDGNKKLVTPQIEGSIADEIDDEIPF